MRSLALTRDGIEQTIAARFETVVQQVPEDRLALRGGGRSWTYAALNREVNRIAHAIRACTPAGGGRIAYLADQSPEMVIATLAILKAGKTYIAIHPHTPAKAQTDILRDVAPDLLLSTAARERDARAIAAAICDVLVLDTIGAQHPDHDPPRTATPRDASTLFYTSGSTGRPKGVIKSHRAVLHRVWLSAQHDAIAVDDRQSLLTHCSFSASESDMFGALLQGAAVFTFDIASRGFSEFRAWVDSERITLLHPPVLFFRRFLATLEPEDLFPHVRIVALAGDVVLPVDLQKWRQHCSRECVVLHRFSITETALLTVARFDRDDDLNGVVLAAGRPVADKTLTLNDDGELLVQSDYLADGYFNRPEETAAAFTLAPDGSGQRIYRTGDLGQFSTDGTFVFLGRRDDQIKIRGFRVELREIDAALMQIEGVSEAVCIAVREEGEQRLRAFIVWQHGRAQTAAAIRTRLKQLLPEWKLPHDFHSLDALPTTLTGKIDRRALGVRQLAAALDCASSLAPLWSKVLRKPVSPDDTFFEDLGGTSLDALEIVNEINRASGRRLPLSLLLELNTVRKMSGYLDAHPDQERTCIALQSAGSRPPLFCVSGKGGSVIPFRALAHALGDDQPFHGLTHHGIARESLPSTLAAFAACYADAILQQQPEGPYYLAGYSSGGLVTFEVARQLARAGHEIAFIGLLDTSATEEYASRWSYYRALIRHGGAWSFAMRAARALVRRVSRAPADRVDGRFFDSLDLKASLQPWSLPVTLFLARQGTGAQSATRDAGWQRLCGSALKIVDVDGDHDTILTSEVEGLAAAFSRALADAQKFYFGWARKKAQI